MVRWLGSPPQALEPWVLPILVILPELASCPKTYAGGVRKKNPIAHLIAHTCCALAYIKIAYIAHTKCKIAHIAHTKIIPFLLHLELLKRYLKA